MRRTSPIMLIVAAIGLMPLMYARSQTQVDSRTAARSATIKRVQVNAQTITALPSGKRYVVDLTQRGVTYEFDAKTDLSRVRVRTAQGAVAIGPWLKKRFSKVSCLASNGLLNHSASELGRRARLLLRPAPLLPTTHRSSSAAALRFVPVWEKLAATICCTLHPSAAT